MCIILQFSTSNSRVCIIYGKMENAAEEVRTTDGIRNVLYIMNSGKTKQVNSYAIIVLMTMSLIFSQITVVLTPLEPRYCHKAFRVLKIQKCTQVMCHHIQDNSNLFFFSPLGQECPTSRSQSTERGGRVIGMIYFCVRVHCTLNTKRIYFIFFAYSPSKFDLKFAAGTVTEWESGAPHCMHTATIVMFLHLTRYKSASLAPCVRD